MLGAFKDFNNRLTGFSNRIEVFNACVRKDRLPQYLMPGGNLLGKFEIEEVIPYSMIVKKHLRSQKSVFGRHNTFTSNASLNSEEFFEEIKNETYDPSALGQDYMTLFGTNYVYRLKTKSVYEEGKPYIFDVFIVHNDAKLREFNLLPNYWNETLMLSQIKDSRAQPVISFGQLPEGIIYREIEEVSGHTLESYINSRLSGK